MANKDGIIISVWTLAHDMICWLTNLNETVDVEENLNQLPWKHLWFFVRFTWREKPFLLKAWTYVTCHFGIQLQECSSHSSSPHSAGASRTERIAASIAIVQCYDYQLGGGRVFSESVPCSETASWLLVHFLHFDSSGCSPINDIVNLEKVCKKIKESLHLPWQKDTVFTFQISPAES